MSSAYHDYQQFLGWLHQPGRGAPEDVLRFANMTLAHFDAVAATTNRQSQRSTTLAAMARAGLAQTSPAPPPPGAAAATGAWAWKSLNSLTIGPFRGFRYAETFNFPRRITTFSGPNGSGKTSLCEALELALLGSVDEAGFKRIAPERYFSNVHEGRHAAPVLVANDALGQPVAVRPDADAYRFCLIEKNRIDNFSRIASKTQGEKTNLIAALFGMDQFHDFVGNFNDSMDGQLYLVAAKQQQLANRRAVLAQDQAMVDGEAAAYAAIAAEEEAYARAYAPGATYADLLAWIGTPDAPGRLQQITVELERTPHPYEYAPNSAGFLAAFHAADAEQRRLDEATGKLAGKTAETSFQNLYNAVLGVQRQSPDHCPACGTPLAGNPRANHDPYAHASAGLDALRDLAALQAEVAAVRKSWEAASRALEQRFAHFAQRIGARPDHADGLYRYIAAPGIDLSRAWWTDGYAPQPSLGKSYAQMAVDLATELERQDVQIRERQAARQRSVEERARLNEAAVAAATYREKRNQVATRVAAARQRIAVFDAANAVLIEEARQEVELIARDQRIKAAYDAFLRLLRQFRAELPSTLIAGLNTLTMELYNEFNVRDPDCDKLALLVLPIAADSRIELAFRGNPERRVDALHVLSEGHVRCLGVAILLAKALSIQAPMIVFDDAINAIDTEHRQGIRETIFESPRFAAMQIIVTCHSSEFIKDIHNHVPGDQWSGYSFMPHPGNFHPRVVGGASQNYLAKARAAFDGGDLRDALGASRQALEMLTDKVWKWLAKNDHGMLTLPLPGRGAEPALRNLCESLRARMREATTFVHPDKPEAIRCLEVVLGVPANNLVWLYLNKGTHEEANRDDYDVGVVQTVLETLEAMARLRFERVRA